MNVREAREELQTAFYIANVAVITVFGILLVIVNYLLRWESIGFYLGILGIVACWVIHIFKIGSDNFQMDCHTATLVVGLLYYGWHETSLTDIPGIICLFVILFAAKQNMRWIYFVLAPYPILLLWHIFGSHYLNAQTDTLTLARVVLGAMCLLCALAVSRFFIEKQIRSQKIQEEAEQKLKNERQEYERFLANVSHELRTPINVVNGMSEIILNQELEPELNENICAIQNAGKRLFSQVSDILDYSELMTDSMKLSNTEYEPISVINDAVANVAWHRMPRNLEFAIDIEPDIPKRLYGDMDKIKKIIVALVDNAIKFTEKGGACLYITHRSEAYGVNLNIDVWDTGCGMEKEELQHLYSGFYKKDSGIERKTGGLGLGLAIVHGMVTAMGGFLSVESEPMVGTHVHVSIPQEVRIWQASIYISNPEAYNIVCYFNTEKYVRKEVGTYYYNMISHVREGLGIRITETNSLQEMKSVLEKQKITHVFIARWEYELDQEYFEELAGQCAVLVFADASFQISPDSKMTILRKPVYMMSVVNALKATGSRNRQGTMIRKQEMYPVKALVVDDDSMNLMVAKGVLQTYGMKVDTCQSGDYAIEKCMLSDYDIVFLDYMMPYMNGIETLHKLREIRKGAYVTVPIVVLTANAVSGAREMFLNEGFDEFMSKPIELMEMSRVLRKVLKKGDDIR